MSVPLVAASLAGWLVLVGLFRWIGSRWLSKGPGDAATGVLCLIVRAYCWLMHRTTYVGLEHVPKTNRPGGLVVVSNHTSPVDPLLMQSACRFEIRWMMAEDMMSPQLDWLWRHQRVIPVARDGRDWGPAREAIRHVRDGGVIGIFPEGGIAIPRGQIRPFLSGAGLVVARCRAPVLLVWISNTPPMPQTGKALTTRSRARVEFIELIDLGDQRDPVIITDRLRQRLAEASGWPRNDEPLVRPPLDADPFAA